MTLPQILLFSLFITLVLAILYSVSKISRRRKKIEKETDEAMHSVTESFSAIRTEIKRQISPLNKKLDLSKEEKEKRNKLQEVLTVSEKWIGREIDDIKREVR